MGQLEKYGLYVLCLVIFLILGVTIWGEDAAAAPGAGKGAVSMRTDPEMRTVAGPRGGQATNGGGLKLLRQAGDHESPHSLLGPVRKPERAEKEPKKTASKEDQPAKQPGQDTPKPAPSDPPKVATTRSYTVKRGDVLGTIAQKQCGSVRFIDEIKRLNPGLRVERLPIGKKIKLPAAGATAKGATAKGPTANGTTARTGAVRSYTVRPGDSYARIAKRELGAESRFTEIQDLNPNVDPMRLRPGQKVRLPLK